MKILVLYPYVPYPIDRGTYQRTFHLLRELARVHEVSLLAIDEHGERVRHKNVFSEFCQRVEIVPFEHPAWMKLFPERVRAKTPATVLHWNIPALERMLDRMLIGGDYDAVHICDIVMAQYFLEKHRDIPIVVDRSRVDLQFQLMEHRQLELPVRTRMLRWENYLKLWFYERAVARRAEFQIVCGKDDERFVRRFISPRSAVSVLPNGVDLQYFSPGASSDPRAEEPTVIFCGTMDYSPNVDGLKWYFKRIHHKLRNLVPELRILIVGKKPAPEILRFAKMPEVTVTGEVSDVRPYYRRAWLQIVPLRIGGGTRLKIVESMAMGTPVVSTSIGAQGLGLCHNNEILLADSPTAFAEETARALQSLPLRRALQRSGLEAVCSRMGWQTIGKELNNLYAKHFANAHPTTERYLKRAA